MEFGRASYMYMYNEMVKNNKFDRIENESVLIGIELDEQGKYREKIYLVNNYTNIAAFVCSTRKNKLLLTTSDRCVLTTMADYVDLCCDTNYLEKLKCELVPMQQGKRKVPKLEYAY